MLRSFALLLLAATLFACQSSTTSAPSVEANTVYWNGALKNIMHKGDLSAQATLAELAEVPHLYALGAVENLKGEVLVLDSKPFIAQANNNAVAIDHSLDAHKATLLVYASVPSWQTVDVPADVVTYEQFETFVASEAASHGVDVEQPFPLMLTGTASSFNWHVIDWPDGDTEHSHEKHVTSGPHGTETNRAVEILGFYSNSHHAIFTHHTTNMHLHVKTADGTLAGHVDGLELGSGMQLKLPVASK